MPENQLVPSNSPNDAVANWGFGQMLGRFFFSLDKGTDNYKRILFSLLNTEGEDIRPFINTPIKITHFLLQPATFNDSKNGEEVTTLMTKLVLDNGKVIVCHSSGVAKALLQASELLGLPSPQSPYICHVRSRQLRDNKSMMYLDFADGTSEGWK